MKYWKRCNYINYCGIQSILEEFKELDFIITSNGGNWIAVQRLISFLRERFNKITAMIPYVAYSAATILALGADEIIMHLFSNLGPVDPQLSFVKMDYMGQIQSKIWLRGYS